MKLYQVLVLVNAALGALLISGGSLTAFAASSSQVKEIGFGLAVAGVLQSVVAAVIHAYVELQKQPNP